MDVVREVIGVGVTGVGDAVIVAVTDADGVPMGERETGVAVDVGVSVHEGVGTKAISRRQPFAESATNSASVGPTASPRGL